MQAFLQIRGQPGYKWGQFNVCAINILLQTGSHITQ
jgi:hypothetical protein